MTDAEAIADTGATENFVFTGTPVKNLSPEIKTILINLPDGSKLMSTHTCELDI